MTTFLFISLNVCTNITTHRNEKCERLAWVGEKKKRVSYNKVFADAQKYSKRRRGLFHPSPLSWECDTVSAYLAVVRLFVGGTVFMLWNIRFDQTTFFFVLQLFLFLLFVSINPFIHNGDLICLPFFNH